MVKFTLHKFARTGEDLCIKSETAHTDFLESNKSSKNKIQYTAGIYVMTNFQYKMVILSYRNSKTTF